jgi:hypothetical protein
MGSPIRIKVKFLYSFSLEYWHSSFYAYPVDTGSFVFWGFGFACGPSYALKMAAAGGLTRVTALKLQFQSANLC